MWLIIWTLGPVVSTRKVAKYSVRGIRDNKQESDYSQVKYVCIHLSHIHCFCLNITISIGGATIPDWSIYL